MGESTESPNPGDLVLLLFFERLVSYLTFYNLSESNILWFQLLERFNKRFVTKPELLSPTRHDVNEGVRVCNNLMGCL